jgi:hypothetical protein
MAAQAKHTGVLSAAGYSVTLNVDGLAGIGIQLTGTWVGTLQFKGSVDGVEFQALTVTPTSSTTGVTSATSNGIWQTSAALKLVQVLCSAYTSGYIVVSMVAGESSLAGSGGGGGGGGDATAANQVLEIAALNSIDTKTPALGQALAAGSVPVVLTAAQISTLTPPSNTGYATSAKQDTGNTSLASIDTKTPALGQALAAASVPVVLTAAQVSTLTPLSSVTVTQATGTNLHAVVDSGTLTAVTAITNALPAGSNVIGHVITDTGSTTAVTGTVTVTGGLTDTQLRASAVPVTAVLTAGSAVIGHVINDASSAVIGHVITDTTSTTAVTQATAANLNAAVVGTGTAGSAAGGVLTVQGVASMTKLLVTPDANSAINLAQVNGTTTVNGGSAAGILAVGGPNATNVAITGNPVNNGAQAVSSENAAVTTARQVQLVADLVGKLIVLPYANPENFVSGAITSAMTGTTSTSLIAAPASGLRNYITQITVSNAHATVGTDVVIQDGSGGTTLYTIPAAAVYGGATLSFPTPLRQPTTATALFCANVTTGASTKVSASGYKGA